MRTRLLSKTARLYIGGVSLAALVAGALLWGTGGVGAPLGPFLVITALAMAAHAFPVQGFRHQAYQVTLPFIITAAAMFSGAQLVAFILLIHLAEQARLRRRLYIQWFNICDYLLSSGLAAVFYHRAIAILPDDPFGQVAAAMAAAVTFVLVNRLLLAGMLWLARRLSLVASGLFKPQLLAADLVIAWVAGPMLALTLQAGPWMVLVTAGPLLLARPGLSRLLHDRRQSAPQTRRRERAA
jgi:hypothetical protein